MLLICQCTEVVQIGRYNYHNWSEREVWVDSCRWMVIARCNDRVSWSGSERVGLLLGLVQDELVILQEKIYSDGLDVVILAPEDTELPNFPDTPPAPATSTRTLSISEKSQGDLQQENDGTDGSPKRPRLHDRFPASSLSGLDTDADKSVRVTPSSHLHSKILRLKHKLFDEMNQF